MAKQQQPFPMMPTGGGGGVLPKVLRWLVGIALVVLVVKFPADAASWVRAAWGTGEGAIEGLVTFFRAVGA
ncbi:hypothetical protein FHX42_004470 [Saccharopolyspora lacisalsi]|uniref:Uncharacterized protein n=1 Tax=Halosaccharopolyspora lacisalsi TaxID=1000566 RepID=A0A839E3C8_9PSEU|nr:hypothetical protein [Halosaccharopolyspora lacisalsi]MBA8827086.1 hypothetical protein [Halosaccharopolyspora lacisalsi]